MGWSEGDEAGLPQECCSQGALDPENEVGDLLVDGPLFFHHFGDAFDGVDDGAVVPSTELAGDGRVGKVRELTEDVHGNLSSRDKGTAATGTRQFLDAEAEALGCRCQDELGRDPTGLTGRDQVREDMLGQFTGDGLPIETAVGGDADEGPFELSDVVGDVRGDELEDVHRDVDSFPFGLLLQDGEPGLEVWGCTSVIRPERNRLRRRLSRVAIDFGGRSEVRTICFEAP